MGPPVETLDLSGILPSGDGLPRFKREIKRGREKGTLWVFIFSTGWNLTVSYSRPGKHRRFRRIYRFEAVPAHLTRDLLRLGASDAFLGRLEAAYAEILQAVRPVEHEDLHTDTGADE